MCNNQTLAPNLPTDTPTIKRVTVIQTRYSNRMSLDHIIQQLRGFRATGEIRVSVSQGGVNAIVFEERKIVG